MVAVGASPDDVYRLVSMLRVVGRFGHQLGRVCDDAATALEDLAPAPATTGPAVGQDDDGDVPPAAS